MLGNLSGRTEEMGFKLIWDDAALFVRGHSLFIVNKLTDEAVVGVGLS